MNAPRKPLPTTVAGIIQHALRDEQRGPGVRLPGHATRSVFLRMTLAEQKVADATLLVEAFRVQASNVDPGDPARAIAEAILGTFEKVLTR